MRITALILAAALLAAPVAAQTAVGLQAIDFNLESIAGDELALSDFQGQVVLLFFFGYT